MQLAPISFVTDNEGKYAEISAIVPHLERISINLQEIQSLDAEQVVQTKLKEAARIYPHKTFIVEDTSLHLGCLNGFPGPLIKWLLQSVGCSGLYDLCDRYGNFSAYSRTIIGLLPETGDAPIFFHGHLDGTIVKPDGTGGFGWDPIFVPAGDNRTLASIKGTQPGAPAMRREAAEKLAEALLTTSLKATDIAPDNQSRLRSTKPLA